MIRIFEYGQVPNGEIFARGDLKTGVEETVSAIIADVRQNGDAALYRYCKQFDKVELTSLEVSAEELQEAFDTVEPEFLEILRQAAENIRLFHEKQVRNSFIIN